jgi:hypothetical protein
MSFFGSLSTPSPIGAKKSLIVSMCVTAKPLAIISDTTSGKRYGKGAELPLGQRFTEVYVQRGKPASDSPRMRRRVAATLIDYGNKFEKYAEEELGIDTPSRLIGGHFKAIQRRI